MLFRGHETEHHVERFFCRFDPVGAMTEPTDDRFAYLTGDRPGKPRDSGLTFVIGDAVTSGGPRGLQDLLEFAGPWIDWYKFVYSSLPLQSPALVQQKLDLLEAHDVQGFPGGNLLEIAESEGVTERFLEDVRSVGVPRVEVSSTVVDIDRDRKTEIVELASEMGFAVHSEVGKKSSETDDALDVDEVVAEMEADVAAGADTVIYESEAVAGHIEDGSETDEAAEYAATFDQIVDAVGKDTVMFEVPLQVDYQLTEISAWFLRRYGPEVNLGNVIPHHANLIEQQRRGIGPGTYRP
jgi:phosphosulfolactate synthase